MHGPFRCLQRQVDEPGRKTKRWVIRLWTVLLGKGRTDLDLLEASCGAVVYQKLDYKEYG